MSLLIPNEPLMRAQTLITMINQIMANDQDGEDLFYEPHPMSNKSTAAYLIKNQFLDRAVLVVASASVNYQVYCGTIAIFNNLCAPKELANFGYNQVWMAAEYATQWLTQSVGVERPPTI